jgi:hypothetical protein
VFIKVANGTEDGAALTFTASGGTAGLWSAVCYGDVDGTTPQDAAAVRLESASNTTTPTLPNQTSVTNDAMSVAFFGGRGVSTAYGSSNSPGSGSTEVLDVQNTTESGLNTVALYIEEQLVPIAGALGQSATMQTSDPWQGVQVVLRPSGGGGGGLGYHGKVAL